MTAGGSVGALAMVLAACGAEGVSGGAGASTAAKSSAPAKVGLIERMDQERQGIVARLSALREKFPNITVEREVVPGAELITKLQTMAASDTLPDNCLSFLGSQSFHNFVVAGAFAKID